MAIPLSWWCKSWECEVLVRWRAARRGGRLEVMVLRSSVRVPAEEGVQVAMQAAAPGGHLGHAPPRMRLLQSSLPPAKHRSLEHCHEMLSN